MALTDERIREIWAQAMAAPVYIVEQALASFARAVEREARREALEEAAKVCENGCFLHDDAPDAKFGRACAAAIRVLIDKEPRT